MEQHLSVENAEAEDDYEIGERLLYGYLGGAIPPDGEEALPYIEKAAEKGDARAYFELARIYEYGLAAVQSNEKMIHYLKLASEKGHENACYELASRYFLGKGVARSLENAIHYLNRAGPVILHKISETTLFNRFKYLADKRGSACCRYILGVCCQEGIGCQQSYEKAYAYYTLAALFGYPKAGKAMGDCYAFGWGVKADSETAEEWYCKSSSFEGAVILAKRLSNSMNFQNKLQAVQLACERSYGPAELLLGQFYLNKKDYAKAFSLFQSAAKKNILDAQFYLAECYEKGEGVTQSKEMALKIYLDLFAKEHPQISHYKLGQVYESLGKLPEAIFHFEEAARGNHSQSHFILGGYYFNGFGVEKSLEKAFHYFLKGAGVLNRACQFYAALCYSEGWGIEKSYTKAEDLFKRSVAGLTWLEKLQSWSATEGLEIHTIAEGMACLERIAERGNELAQLYVGVIFERGIENVEISPNKAFYYWQLAANQGNERGLFLLGRAYLNGFGVTASLNQALKNLEAAAEKKEPHALLILGELYLRGNNVLQDEVKAVDYFRKSYEQKNARAAIFLGYCYEHGLGVLKDPSEAVKLYEFANFKDPLSDCYLGLCYEKGIGVEASPERAFEHYSRAVKQKVWAAGYWRGLCYKNGIGVKKDLGEAFYNFTLAANEGDPPSLFELGSCYQYGLGVAKDEQKAFYYYQKAAKRQDHWAVAKLADCYQEGIGVEKSEELYDHYYNMSIWLKQQQAEVEFPEEESA